MGIINANFVQRIDPAISLSLSWALMSTSHMLLTRLLRNTRRLKRCVLIMFILYSLFSMWLRDIIYWWMSDGQSWFCFNLYAYLWGAYLKGNPTLWNLSLCCNFNSTFLQNCFVTGSILCSLEWIRSQSLLVQCPTCCCPNQQRVLTRLFLFSLF